MPNPVEKNLPFSNSPISEPLRKAMNAVGSPDELIKVIVTLRESDANQADLGGAVKRPKEEVKAFLTGLGYNPDDSDFYVFASLRPADIEALAKQTDSVFQIWPDEDMHLHLVESADTVKAPASWRTFEARGKDIVWAVLDTGIKADHPHFKVYANVDATLSKDFSSNNSLDDLNGHGTHVAGIIAGCWSEGDLPKAAVFTQTSTEREMKDLKTGPSGVAPLTKLINVKVMNNDGSGSASATIRGLEYVRKLNQGSFTIRVDGVNLSLGHPFDPKWYGCGYSPLCMEVTRAVDSGLIVVVSCGNAGYGISKVENVGDVPMCRSLSITDPANCEDAIAVGSVHKSKPHSYGISYFSSKGPTGDGRIKPDLVAPGERIISASIHLDQDYQYMEDSGTSMAAPHVSGAIAAFLSVHKEYRGVPVKVKEIFMKSATDLGRDRNFQGAGLVDLLRALMSV